MVSTDIIHGPSSSQVIFGPGVVCYLEVLKMGINTLLVWVNNEALVIFVAHRIAF